MWSLRPNAEANSEAESVMKRLLYPRPDKSSTKKWLKYHVLNFTLQPRALSFNRFRSQPKAFTTGDIYLNWWHTLVFWHFQLPDLKQEFIWFQQRPHNYTPLFSIFNFSCQLLSEIIFLKSELQTSTNYKVWIFLKIIVTLFISIRQCNAIISETVISYQSVCSPTSNFICIWRVLSYIWALKEMQHNSHLCIGCDVKFLLILMVGAAYMGEWVTQDKSLGLSSGDFLSQMFC